MKRVLVTGSSGFIGRHAVPELLRLRYEVHAADLRPAAPAAGVTSHQVNLLDAAQVSELLKKIGPTYLVHFAWYAEHGKFWTSPLNLDWVAASLSMFKSFAENGGKRAVFAGTCAEYDWSHAHLIEDLTPSNPATLYGVCKNSLREIAGKFAIQSGVELAWARVFFLYGPNEHPNRLIPSIVNPLLRNEPAVVRSGAHVRDILHVEDVARAFAAILNSSLQGIVNIGSGMPVTLGEVARIAAELTGQSHLLKIEEAAGTPSNPQVMTAETAKLRTTGFVPRYALREGLANLLSG